MVPLAYTRTPNPGSRPSQYTVSLSAESRCTVRWQTVMRLSGAIGGYPTRRGYLQER